MMCTDGGHNLHTVMESEEIRFVNSRSTCLHAVTWQEKELLAVNNLVGLTERGGILKRIICLFLVIMMVLSLTGCQGHDSLPYILPVTTVRNNIHITVDPRVELVSIVQYLSSYNELMTAAEFSYCSDVDEYFGKYSNHEAVTMYESMVETGFMFSAPANFALGLTDGLYMDDSVKLSQHVRWGGGGAEQLKKFAQALRDFSRESDFHNFYASKEDFYRDNVYRVAILLEDWDFVSELQDYFGMEYKSFNVIPVPLYGGGGGYGPYVERGDGIDIYSILISFDDHAQGDVPLYGTKDIFRLLLRHEFSHSFVNRITDMYLDEVMEYEHLIDPIQQEMDALNYGSWITCLNEHVVRAVTVRLAFSDDGAQGRKALIREIEGGFTYTDVLVDALVEYENNREQYPDFISFYPRLLDALGK